MQWKTALVVAALVALPVAPPVPIPPAALFSIAPAALFPIAPAALAAGNCDPGDKLDSSTAADARKKLEAAGYSQVRDLKKGCDNVWHAKAVKDGGAVNLALTPDGQIRRETD